MNVIPDESMRVVQAKQRYRFESLEALKNIVSFIFAFVKLTFLINHILILREYLVGRKLNR
jgi:hypothetical protein